MTELQTPAQDPIRILVVDDDPDVVRATGIVLSRAGHSVVTAGTGAEALQAIRRAPPDLILLDRHLPDIDGLEVCRQVKSDPEVADTLVVMTSAALAAEQDQIAGLTSGADGYIVRPIGNRELAARVEAFVRLVRMSRTLKEQTGLLEAKVAELGRLKQEADARVAEATAANHALVDSRRAALNLIDDAMDARRSLESANRDLQKEFAVRQRAEDSLRKVSAAAEQSPVSILITDLQGNIEYVNPHFEQVTGYSSAEVVGKNPRLLQSGETDPMAYRQLWSSIASGGIWEGEFHNKKKNGELFWERATIAPVRDLSGAITSFVGVTEDNTERKRTEQALRESEERHRLLAENVSDVIWTIDTEERFTYVSPSVEKLRGYTVAQVVGNRMHDGLTPESAALARSSLAHALEQVRAGQPFPASRLELEQVRKDGSTVWTEVTTSGMVDGEGRLISIIGVTRDISERKEAQEKVAAQLNELLRWQSVMLGREGRVMDLKREVNDLSQRLGIPTPYQSQEPDEGKQP